MTKVSIAEIEKVSIFKKKELCVKKLFLAAMVFILGACSTSEKQVSEIIKKNPQIVFDVIEQIEISFRCKLAYHLSHEFGAWWFEDSSNFIDTTEHKESLNAIDRELGYNKKKEVFLKEHYKKYKSEHS